MQSKLKQTGLYLRLKASPVYDMFWKLRDPRHIDNRDSEVRFYRSVLTGFRSGDLIFDVGANAGDKTDIFLRLGARVIAVEPDEKNQQILRGKFLSYRVQPKPVTIVGRAVSEEIGVETMWVDGPGSALNTLSRKWADTLHQDTGRIDHYVSDFSFVNKRNVETTTLEHLIAAEGRPYFIKIDVEGYELRVLRGLQQPVPYLSFEVNLPEFREEGLGCIELLGNLDALGRFNYTANTKTGLALREWSEPEMFTKIFQNCCEKSIEIFWRSLPDRVG